MNECVKVRGRALSLSHILSNKREAIRVHACRWDSEEDIATPDAAAIDKFVLFHNTHREAAEVVLAFIVEIRHLCRLRTDATRDEDDDEADDDKMRLEHVNTRGKRTIVAEKRANSLTYEHTIHTDENFLLSTLLLCI